MSAPLLNPMPDPNQSLGDQLHSPSFRQRNGNSYHAKALLTRHDPQPSSLTSSQSVIVYAEKLLLSCQPTAASLNPPPGRSCQ